MELEHGVFLYGFSELGFEILLGFKLAGLNEFINVFYFKVFELRIGIEAFFD